MGSPPRTTETFTRDQLLRTLDRLQADGRWSPYHAATLLQELDRTAPPVAPSRRPASGSRVAEAAGYAGAVLIGAAGAVLVGQQWESLGRSGRVTVLAAVTLVLVGVGVAVALAGTTSRAALRQPSHAVRRRLASTALTIAAGTAAGAVGNLVPDPSLVLAAGTAVLVVALAQGLAPSAVSEIGGITSVALFAGALLEDTHAPDPTFLVTIAVVGLAWAALAWSPVLTDPSLGLALGLGVALWVGWLGAFYGTQPEETIGITLLGLMAAGGLAGYVRTGRWPLASAAALALATLVFRLTTHSLGAPIALLLTGLVLLGSGAVVLLRRRTAEQP